ncbi:MAG: MFS transporter [Gemmataceae bacterium]
MSHPNGILSPDIMKPSWFNRTVIGAGLTSFLADIGYEMACSLIPSFLLALGLPGDRAAVVLGAVEAVAEFVSNGAKLIVGWYSDKIGKRKVFVVGGYALTGTAFAFIAIGMSWPAVMLAKSLAWLGKGIRGPLRNAIISDAVEPNQRGKAFGFHRAGDTMGAVLGPLIGAAFLWWIPFDSSASSALAYRYAFWFTVIPGIGAALAFAFLVTARRFNPKPGLRLGASLSAMPRPFRSFLVAVGLFGIGDFSHSLLILIAANSLQAESITTNPGDPTHLARGAVIGLLLYTWRNLIQALAAFPAGWLGDRFQHRTVLVVGYLLGAITMIGFATLVNVRPDWLAGWVLLFALAGIYMAIQETVEPAIVPELVMDKQVQGTAFGVLAAVNSYGDVIASLTVGYAVYAFGWSIALGYAATLMTLGAVGMILLTHRSRGASQPDSPTP